MYDAIVVGGSIAGLCCAREIAKNGHSVMVLEEDHEIGTPEHCGGLVSLAGLEDLGVIPSTKTLDHIIENAEIFAPNGSKLVINTKKQKVAEIKRRELDKQIAYQAQKNGADIRVNSRVSEIHTDGVKINQDVIKCKIVVDARGVSSLIPKNRNGVLFSAQFEIFAEWIKKENIQVYLDQEKYPGFFAWVIPSGNGVGKVGVAGKNINVVSKMEELLTKKGKYSVIRKIFAPIWINGAISNFVKGNIIVTGDAAGQSKPTTAGGIYSCGMGGIYAGKAISKFLQSHNKADLEEYHQMWFRKFGKEFQKQFQIRKLLERLDNKTINELFESVSPKTIEEISKNDDFDFHTSSILKLLGVKGTLKTAKSILNGEIRKLTT